MHPRRSHIGRLMVVLRATCLIPACVVRIVAHWVILFRNNRLLIEYFSQQTTAHLILCHNMVQSHDL